MIVNDILDKEDQKIKEKTIQQKQEKAYAYSALVLFCGQLKTTPTELTTELEQRERLLNFLKGAAQSLQKPVAEATGESPAEGRKKELFNRPPSLSKNQALVLLVGPGFCPFVKGDRIHCVTWMK